MKNIHAILLVLLMGLSEPLFAQPPENVSIIQLITTPEKFQNRRVQLIVFLHVEFEGDAIYLHQEDYEKGLFRNALWIDLTTGFADEAEKLNNSYVIVSGVFDGKHNGHMGLFSGTLTKIDRLDVWPSQHGAPDTQQ